MSEIKFYYMTFMPYTHLPEGHESYDSLWVDFPNKHYDPVKGKALYARYLDEFVLAERLGFDGLVVNEHHQSVYSMMAAPNLIASALIQRTSRAKICVWGTPPNLEFPSRLAEEYAILDVMSGGRLEVAFPLGTGMEYWSHPINPATSRARSDEAVQCILQAWREDGPTAFYGDFFTYRYLNPWPRPYQRPHPKVYIVGGGSPESMEFAARMGVGYAVAFTPHKVHIQYNERVRRMAKDLGHILTPDQFPMGTMCYVAETDAQAEAEFKPHVEFYFKNCLRTTARFLAPPGYMTLDKVRTNLEYQADVHGSFDWEKLTRTFRIVAGSPETVAEKIWQWSRDIGSTIVNCQSIGDMPAWKTVKNLSLLAEEVFPRVRALEGAAGGKPKRKSRRAKAAAE